MSVTTRRLALFVLVAVPAPAGAATSNYGALQVLGTTTVTGVMSDLAAGIAQPVVGGSCYLNVNGFGPAAYCGGYSDTSSSDVGYYVGFRAGSGGGNAIEVDNSTTGQSGGWGINPTNQFLPGSGGGAAAVVTLDNQNGAAGYSYNGMQIDSEGTTNLLAALSVSGSNAPMWKTGIIAASGIATDGIGDHSNAFTDLRLNSAHAAGILIEPGTILRQGLLVMPSDPGWGRSNSQITWTALNGTNAGHYSIGPMRANFTMCGLCMVTPPAPAGGIGEIDAVAGGGLVVTGAVAAGAASGTAPASVEQVLAATGTAMTLTPDGGAASATDNASAALPASLSPAGTATVAPVAGQIVDLTVLCSGSGSSPNLVSARAYVPAALGSTIAASTTRLAGTGPIPSVTLTRDPKTGALLPTVTTTAPTACVASIGDLVVPGG